MVEHGVGRALLVVAGEQVPGARHEDEPGARDLLGEVAAAVGRDQDVLVAVDDRDRQARELGQPVAGVVTRIAASCAQLVRAGVGSDIRYRRSSSSTSGRSSRVLLA